MPARVGIPSTPLLIVNPRSFRASRGLAERASALALAHGVEVVRIDGPASLTAAVEAILSLRRQHVMVLAGDGTVRAVVDQLAALPAGAWIPDLLVLPGGRSNMTAIDLAPGRDALSSMKRAMKALAGQRWDAGVAERATLRIEQSPAPPRYGFWVGGAVVDSAIRRTHAHRASGVGLERSSPLSTLSSLLRLAVLGLRGESGIACPDMLIDAGLLGQLSGPVSLLIATTLHHRRGFFDPYASRADNDMRLTAVARHAAGFWRSLPRLLTGRFSRRMTVADGFLSGACDVARITGLAGYSLDGEPFDTDPGRPVILRQGPRLRFYQP